MAREKRVERVPTARSVAARVLERVEKDGAFAAAALDTEIDRHPQLGPEERGLLTEIVYGVLRTRGALLERLAEHAPRGLPKDAAVLHHLLIAAYQVLLLDRVPAHAAVDAAVSAISAARGGRVGGFANALLRRLAAGPKLDRDAAIIVSAPAWLLAAAEESVGKDEARALFGAGSLTDTTAVRVVSGRSVPEWLERAEKGRISPLARVVHRGGDLRRREGYADGAFVVQEEGAQVVALALGARPGERVLDACAGRGQKTTLLRERVGPGAELWAADLYEEKLRVIATECARLGLEPPRSAAVDWSVGEGAVPGGLDRVLVDAPCTGTGTLRRRPEIAARLKPGDPRRLGGVSEAILRRASARARLGGRVVFAVCSVLREEAEDVMARVADVLRPVPFDAPELAAIVAPGETAFRLLPLRHGTDGFFVASFERR